MPILDELPASEMTKLVLSLTDDENKMKYLEQIKDLDFIYDVVMSFQNDNNKIKYIDHFNNDQIDAIFRNLKNQNDEYKSSIINTLPFEKKVSGVINLTSDENKNKYLEQITDVNIICKVVRSFKNSDENVNYVSKMSDNNLKIECLSYLLYEYFLPGAYLKDFSLDIANYVIDNNWLGTEKFKTLENLFQLCVQFDNEEFSVSISNFIKQLVHKEMDEEKFFKIPKVINLCFQSNSNEIEIAKERLILQLISKENMDEEFHKIEEIFLTNNISYLGKTFEVFKKLYPNYDGLSDFSSPMLLKANDKKRDLLVFADLAKVTLGSNNRNIKKFLNSIKLGNDALKKTFNGDVLTKEETDNLNIYCEHLFNLYNHTKDGKINEISRSNNLEKDVEILKEKFKVEDISQLLDRITKMFLHFAGIDKYNQAVLYMDNKMNCANKRNRANSNKKLLIQQGDFVKGFNIKFIDSLLQNGIVNNEYYGSAGGNGESDYTPFDADCSKVDIESGDNLTKIYRLEASHYGPPWLVFKNDDRFVETRSNNVVQKDEDRNKIEVFNTFKENTHGIRTGIAATEVDYIVCENVDFRLKQGLARNGLYIPVVNSSGEVIFKPEEYDQIRHSMMGLSYYGADKYELSPRLLTDDIISIASNVKATKEETSAKRKVILECIKNSLPFGLDVKEKMDDDLRRGSLEILDTGSTGRGTNKPHDGDFDFIVRVDKDIILDKEKMMTLRKILPQLLGKKMQEIILDLQMLIYLD